MDLYKEIDNKVLEKEDVCIALLNLKVDENEIIETACYKALQKVKSIIEDNGIEAKDKIIKIEKITGLFY